MDENTTIKTLVRGRWIITDPSLGMDGILEDGAVAIDDKGQVGDVDAFDRLTASHPEATIEGSADALVMPGMIDAHSHGMGLSYFELGLGYDHLESWNLQLPSVARPDPYLDHIWCAIKHLRSGCTTLHHMGDNPDIAVQSYRDLGIRWAFSLTVKNRNFITYDDPAFLKTLPDELHQAVRSHILKDPEQVKNQFLDHFDRAWTKYHTPGTPVFLGPMGAQWCTEDLLTACRDRASKYGTRIHMHGVQTPYQREALLREHEKSAIEYLADLDVLGPNFTLGHGVWLNDRDMDLLAESGTSLTHHASCNLHMRNGILPLPELLARGIPVAIGVDGKGINDDEDMIQELKVVEKLHRLYDLTFGAPLLSAETIVQMATQGGAHVLGLETVVGTLTQGKAADITVIDMVEHPWMDPKNSPYERLVMHTPARDVHTVLVDGQVVMRDREILTLDEEALLDDLYQSIRDSVARAAPTDTSRTMKALYPHVKAFYADWEPVPNQPFTPYYAVNRKC